MSAEWFELTVAPASAADVAANTAAIALKADTEQTVNDQVGTTYTLQASDSGKLVRCTNAASITVTVPDTFGPTAGKCIVISVAQGGAGKVSLVGSGTMVITKPATFAAATREQYSEVTLRIFSTTSGRLSGDLSF